MFDVSCLQWKSFLDGIQSPLVSAKLQPCLEAAWPVIFQAVALDAVPLHFELNLSSRTTENTSENTFISGYSMVQLKPEEFQFLWGFALLVLFEGQNPVLHKPLVPLHSAKAKLGGDSQVEDTTPVTLKSYEIVLPVFQFLSTERFFSMGFLTMDICIELLQVSGLELFFCFINVNQLIFSVNLSCLSYLLTRSNVNVHVSFIQLVHCAKTTSLSECHFRLSALSCLTSDITFLRNLFKGFSYVLDSYSTSV